jgi:hypothetical protein
LAGTTNSKTTIIIRAVRHGNRVAAVGPCRRRPTSTVCAGCTGCRRSTISTGTDSTGSAIAASGGYLVGSRRNTAANHGVGRGRATRGDRADGCAVGRAAEAVAAGGRANGAAGAAGRNAASGIARHRVATGGVSALRVAGGRSAVAACGRSSHSRPASTGSTVRLSVATGAFAAEATSATVCAVTGPNHARLANRSFSADRIRAHDQVSANVDGRGLGAAAIATGRVARPSRATNAAGSASGTSATGTGARNCGATGSADRSAARSGTGNGRTTRAGNVAAARRSAANRITAGGRSSRSCTSRRSAAGRCSTNCAATDSAATDIRATKGIGRGQTSCRRGGCRTAGASC